jgi:hypothetical protein
MKGLEIVVHVVVGAWIPVLALAQGAGVESHTSLYTPVGVGVGVGTPSLAIPYTYQTSTPVPGYQQSKPRTKT